MDLNLVRVFVAVFEARSLTVAATRLFVTQPAVSQALGRLREEFDDRLFLRVGRSMRPTSVAEDLYPEFREALARLDRAVDGARGFDPAISERRFRIALSELGELGYLPSISSALRAVAPRAALDVVALDADRLPDWLARGTVDLAITSSPVPDGFESHLLRMQRYAVLLAAHHPLAAVRELPLDAYLEAEHVAVTMDSGRADVEAALGRLGASGPRLTVNRFAALPALLSGTDAVATVPDNLALGWFRTWPLVVRPLPFAMDPLEIRLVARATGQHAAALGWFRRLVLDAVDSVGVELFRIGEARPAGHAASRSAPGAPRRSAAPGVLVG